MTAERVAMRRAAHQVLDLPPVFRDPLALRHRRRGGGRRAARRGRDRPRQPAPAGVYRRAQPRTSRTSSRSVVDRGVDQYVVLGAGLDTFAYRNPYPRAARLRGRPSGDPILEARAAGVERHPGSGLVWRSRRSTSSASGSPMRCRALGFDSSRPAFFAWLGVVRVSDGLDAIFETLRFVAFGRAGDDRRLRLPHSARPADPAPARALRHHRRQSRRRGRTVADVLRSARTRRPAPRDRLQRRRRTSMPTRSTAAISRHGADGLRIEGVGRFAHLDTGQPLTELVTRALRATRATPRIP